VRGQQTAIVVSVELSAMSPGISVFGDVITWSQAGASEADESQDVVYSLLGRGCVRHAHAQNKCGHRNVLFTRHIICNIQKALHSGASLYSCATLHAASSMSQLHAAVSPPLPPPFGHAA
jgi:hypothetical protein